MFKNYLISAFRNLMRNRLESFINITGLAIGLAGAMLIALFVRSEVGFDKFWQDHDRIYTIEYTAQMAGREPEKSMMSHGPLKQALLNYFPNEIEAAARLNNYFWSNITVTIGSEKFLEGINWVDPEFLEIFNFEVVRGDLETALSDNTTMIMDETTATKYFGEKSPIGETFTLNLNAGDRVFKIGAVVRDLPENTHLSLGIMLPIVENNFANNSYFELWNASNNYTYFKLKPGIDINQISSRLVEFTNASVPSENNNASETTIFSPIAIGDIHLKSDGSTPMKPRGDNQLVWAFSIIAVLILVVAAFNFINLSTARAGQRAREVSLRKIMGAGRRQLLTQHLTESFLTTTLAFFLALTFSSLVLPFLEGILGRTLLVDFWNFETVLSVAMVLLGIGLLSGIYPSIVLSSFRPSENLKVSNTSDTKGSRSVRASLVVFQSAVTICLIVGALGVFSQLSLLRSLDRGFNDDQLVVFDVGRGINNENLNTFNLEVNNLPNVQNVTLVSEAPGFSNDMNMGARKLPDFEGNDWSGLGLVAVDPDFFETYQIPLLAGRYYDRERATDRIISTTSEEEFEEGNYAQGSIIINQAAVRSLGLGSPEEALGQRILVGSGYFRIGAEVTIIGVVPNVKFHTLKQEPRPESYLHFNMYGRMVVRYTGNPQIAITEVENIWLGMFPEVPFNYSFVNETLAVELQNEAYQFKMLFAFVLFTIIIGCLGLYGLAAFESQRRTKEIGLRKILGANVNQIVRLLMAQFSRPVILANIIAWPIAGYYLNGWLLNFPFRIETFSIGYFCLGAGILALFIAWVTVAGHAWRVARANPINALRYE